MYFSLSGMCFVPDQRIYYKIKGHRMSYVLLIHLYCANATHSFDYCGEYYNQKRGRLLTLLFY